MKQKDKSQISVTFYLKKISSKNQKEKAVYATVAYRGTLSKVATGIRCEDPRKDWIKNAFSGSQFGKLNSKKLNQKLKDMMLLYLGTQPKLKMPIM